MRGNALPVMFTGCSAMCRWYSRTLAGVPACTCINIKRPASNSGRRKNNRVINNLLKLKKIKRVSSGVLWRAEQQRWMAQARVINKPAGEDVQRWCGAYRSGMSRHGQPVAQLLTQGLCTIGAVVMGCGGV